MQHTASFRWLRAALAFAVLLGAVLTGCSKAKEEPPPPPPANPEVPAHILRMEKLARDLAHLRKKRAVAREHKKAEFSEDYNLYQQILDEYETADARVAAWGWMSTAWDVSTEEPAPAKLVWDERSGQVTPPGAPAREITLRLDDKTSFTLIWVEPGLFMMGSPDTEYGRGQDEQMHAVTINEGFWMGKTEVTQAVWEKIMGANPSYFTAAGPDAPVEQVSWIDCQEFMIKLNLFLDDGYTGWVGFSFRLPTEAEWEYACRAGTITPVYPGKIQILGANHSPELDYVAWYGGNSGVDYPGGWDSSKWQEKQYAHITAGTHPVGMKLPNPWGFHDMLGNVWEWCQDVYGDYPADPVIDPYGADKGTHRVTRGASWGNLAYAHRAAIRNPLLPEGIHTRVGLRVVATP